MKNILENKYYLYLTEFFAGMAVMAVEQGASRLLAPYFSSSQIVWTIIIGTIMIAMALGNIYGGRQADKDADPAKLYRRIIIAAVWIAAIPLVGKYIIIGIAGVLIVAVNTNFLIWAAFLACMVIFVFPLFLLGTVTPCLTKYTMDSLSDNASIVGTLGACNTVGSIIGTFLPTFVTIPSAGTAVTFLIFSGVLLILGLLYFIVNGGGKKLAAVATVLFVLCSIFGNSDSFAFWEDRLTYEGESIYNYLQVYDDDRATILSTNVLFGVQSIRMKQQNLTGMYYDYALAAPVMNGMARADEEKKMLILGMGTGTFAQQSAKYFPKVEISGVEIDQKITDLAHEYFDLPEEIQVTTYDGRAYLNSDDEKYDVIMVDAYQDITIPPSMSTVEFFALVREHLDDGGVMVVNINMRSESEGSINEYLFDTIASVFDYVYAAQVPGTTNIELFASSDAQMLSRFSASRELLGEGHLLYPILRSVDARLTEIEGGELLLTDDRAPVELLGMRVLDEIIMDELTAIRSAISEKGIFGFLSDPNW